MGTAHERGPWPGLVLEWRRLPSREWQARVIFVPGGSGALAVQDWFAAALLRPVEDVEPPTSQQTSAARYHQAAG